MVREVPAKVREVPLTKIGLVLIALTAFAGVGFVQPDCLGLGSCEERRVVDVPLELRVEHELPESFSYDYAEVTEEVAVGDLTQIHDLSLSVRLILGEVGADRILLNRYGPIEAFGILQTVDNRRNPLVYNPLNESQAPTYPGCDVGKTRGHCAPPSEYLGLASRRALRPGTVYVPEVLEEAVDRAALVWWLKEKGWGQDPTGGATSFVHRCGGEAYGATTGHCDGRISESGEDTPGAEPTTGPLVFKGPKRWIEERGVYTLGVTAWVDHDPWWPLLPGRGLGKRVPSRYGLLGIALPEKFQLLTDALGPVERPVVLGALSHNGGLKIPGP